MEIKVIVDGVEYYPAEQYGLELTLSKVDGWNLWVKIGSGYNLIGNQYSNEFCVMFGDETIVEDQREKIK